MYICTNIYAAVLIYTYIYTENGTIVPDPGKGVYADPVNGGAILGKGGPDPQGGTRSVS